MRQRLLARAKALELEPRPQGSQKLRGEEIYRLRVGDYRIVYEIDDHAAVVTIARVRHRRDVYRRLR